MALGLKLEIEQTRIARGRIDGAVEIELVCRTLARKAPQLAQRDLDVARAELDRVVEVAELALLPDLDGAAIAARATDADAFGVEAAVAERRRPARADPLVATGVPLLLLAQPLLQRLHELVPAAERLDLRLLLVGQHPLHREPQPLGRDIGLDVRRTPSRRP